MLMSVPACSSLFRMLFRRNALPDPIADTQASGGHLVWSLPGVQHTAVRTVTLIVLVPLSAAAGFVYTRQPIFALLGPAFLAPVLTRYFLKPSYRLSAESARASWGTGQTEIRWENVRRVILGERAIHLSPIERADLRQSFRGVELRLPEDRETRERISDFVREHVSAEAISHPG